jgi:hypothetical protein
MNLLDLPQELLDEIFALAYPGEKLDTYLTREKWDLKEMERLRHDATHVQRPFPEPKVCQFFVSKRYLFLGLGAWIGNQAFDASDWFSTFGTLDSKSLIPYFCRRVTQRALSWNRWPKDLPKLRHLTLVVDSNVFKPLDPSFAWKCAYTKEDLMLVVDAGDLAESYTGLVSVKVKPGFQPYSKTAAENQQWLDNLKALEAVLVSILTGPRDEQAQRSPMATLDHTSGLAYEYSRWVMPIRNKSLFPGFLSTALNTPASLYAPASPLYHHGIPMHYPVSPTNLPTSPWSISPHGKSPLSSTLPGYDPVSAHDTPKWPHFCRTSPCRCGSSSGDDPSGYRSFLRDHDVSSDAQSLVKDRERNKIDEPELTACDVPDSIGGIIELMSKNPSVFLRWVKKAKEQETGVAATACWASIPAITPEVDAGGYLECNSDPTEGSLLPQAAKSICTAQTKARNNIAGASRKRSGDPLDHGSGSKKVKHATKTDACARAKMRERYPTSMDIWHQKQIMQGAGTMEIGRRRTGESWFTSARAGQIESASYKIQCAIQPKIMGYGWAEEASDKSFAGYVAFMVLRGQSPRSLRVELGVNLLGVGEEDVAVVEFVEWLFVYLNSIED